MLGAYSQHHLVARAEFLGDLAVYRADGCLNGTVIQDSTGDEQHVADELCAVQALGC